MQFAAQEEVVHFLNETKLLAYRGETQGKRKKTNKRKGKKLGGGKRMGEKKKGNKFLYKRRP